MSAACPTCLEAMTGGYGQEMCWPCLLSDQLADTERALTAARADAAKAWAQAGCTAEALTVAQAQLARSKADAAEGWAQAEAYADARLRLAAELEGVRRWAGRRKAALKRERAQVLCRARCDYAVRKDEPCWGEMEVFQASVDGGHVHLCDGHWRKSGYVPRPEGGR